CCVDAIAKVEFADIHALRLNGNASQISTVLVVTSDHAGEGVFDIGIESRHDSPDLLKLLVDTERPECRKVAGKQLPFQPVLSRDIDVDKLLPISEHRIRYFRDAACHR